nr:uncharacterized protein LOC127491561 isoform X1 [Oryctolagus cuniculus]
MPGAAGPCKSLAGLPPLRTGFFSPSPKRQPHRRAGESPWGGGVSGSSQTHLPHSFPLDHPGESCGGWVPYPLPLSHSSEEERMQGGGVLPPPSTVHYSTSLGLPPPPHCFLGLKRMEPAEGRLKSYRMKPGHPGGAATLQSRAVSGEKGVVIGLGEGTHFSESRPGHPTCKGGEEKVGKERKGSPTHCPLPGPETDRSAGTKVPQEPKLGSEPSRGAGVQRWTNELQECPGGGSAGAQGALLASRSPAVRIWPAAGSRPPQTAEDTAPSVGAEPRNAGFGLHCPPQHQVPSSPAAALLTLSPPSPCS